MVNTSQHRMTFVRLEDKSVDVRGVTVNIIAVSLIKKMKVKQYKIRSKFMQKIKWKSSDHSR